MRIICLIKHMSKFVENDIIIIITLFHSMKNRFPLQGYVFCDQPSPQNSPRSSLRGSFQILTRFNFRIAIITPIQDEHAGLCRHTNPHLFGDFIKALHFKGNLMQKNMH